MRSRLVLPAGGLGERALRQAFCSRSLFRKPSCPDLFSLPAVFDGWDKVQGDRDSGSVGSTIFHQ